MTYNNYGNAPAEYAFVSPEGVVHTGTGIREFAKAHGLDAANMYHVHAGERRQHKGWTAADFSQVGA